MPIVPAPDWARVNPEWAAPLRLLGSPALRSKGCLSAVNFDRREIDFPTLAGQAGAWSHGQRILFCAAWSLFNGGDRAAFAALLDGDLLAEAITTLDSGNFALLLEAIQLRRPNW